MVPNNVDPTYPWLTVYNEGTSGIQSNLDSSNTDGSFTMANSNSF